MPIEARHHLIGRGPGGHSAKRDELETCPPSSIAAE
jgi:hypothetical protein